jgi:TatD DNase family protein
MSADVDILVDVHTHNPRPGVLSPTMAGIHPWDAERGLELPDLSSSDIIGETGLDYACEVSREAQQRLFEWHLAEAERLNKPVVIHCVKAFEDVMNTLGKHRLAGVILHGFVGSKEQAKRAIERGYYLSFGRRSLGSPRSCEAIKITPIEQLFCKTDDDKTLDISEIYHAVAKHKELTFEELAKQLEKNHKRLFRQ